MNNSNQKTPLRVVNALVLGLTLAGGAGATQVQSALQEPQVGLALDQLMHTTFSTNIALPTGLAKPSSMGNVVAGVHLGTNTDVFAVGTKSGFNVNSSEFWVRYTLDASSYEHHQFMNWEDIFGPPSITTTPVSGELWISFNVATQSLQMHTEKLTGNLLEFSDTGSIYLFPEEYSLTSTLRGGGSGEPEYEPLPGTNASLSYPTCIECRFQWNLNLSFLQFFWTGSGYELFTSAQGFDQIYAFSSEFPPNQAIDRYYANIAPVPVPAALWLFGSSLLGLRTLRRRAA